MQDDSIKQTLSYQSIGSQRRISESATFNTEADHLLRSVIHAGFRLGADDSVTAKSM